MSKRFAVLAFLLAFSFPAFSQDLSGSEAEKMAAQAGAPFGENKLANGTNPFVVNMQGDSAVIQPALAQGSGASSLNASVPQPLLGQENSFGTQKKDKKKEDKSWLWILLGLLLLIGIFFLVGYLNSRDHDKHGNPGSNPGSNPGPGGCNGNGNHYGHTQGQGHSQHGNGNGYGHQNHCLNP